MAWWANRIPSSITSSLSSLAPASTIMMASLVPATYRLRSETLRSSSLGMSTYSPLTRPTRTAPVGPFHGISLTAIATEEPIMAGISGWTSCSMERMVTTTCTSLRMALLNSGRRGRSIRRQVSVALSVGRPSRLMKPPGILPTEYCFSSTSTARGKKSTPSRGVGDMVAFTITTVSPRWTQTDPLACPQYLPNSRVSVLPARSME